MKQIKYIFVSGGVASSLGKGVSIASIGTLLEARGFKVTIQKMDPYINVDPGTMSPYQHGEVYVTDDGAETDLDLGYYERFTNANLSQLNSVSTGQIYQTVIQRERRGEYLGRTVQVIPHITNEIKNRIKKLGKNDPDLDFVLIEIGGTVGDIESVPFLEAIRQFRFDKGYDNTLYIHVTLVPTISGAGEVKTKPTQHSVKELLKIGIQPDFLITRSNNPLDKELKKKIALFCNVPSHRVISACDIEDSIYEVPMILHKEKMDDEIIKFFGLTGRSPLFDEEKNPNLFSWEKNIEVIKNPKREITIGVVGKYIALSDAYRSIFEALWHGGFPHQCKVNIAKISSEDVSKENVASLLRNLDGVLIPGGFGDRGITGKLIAIEHCRENNIPLLGICLGLHCMVIEFSRNVLNLSDANSTEFDSETKNPVITIMDDQVNIVNKGGTMRLGAYPCKVKNNTLLYEAYKTDVISERHRHRFEVNNDYREVLEKNGMMISGTAPDDSLVETIELKQDIHPWFVSSQFHPEFKSKPVSPHPLFERLVYYALKHTNKV